MGNEEITTATVDPEKPFAISPPPEGTGRMLPVAEGREWVRWELAMGALPENDEEVPPRQTVRGRCPKCGADLVANMYWLRAGTRYMLRYECWESLRPMEKCDFYAIP